MRIDEHELHDLTFDLDRLVVIEVGVGVMVLDWRGEQQQRDYNEHHDDHRVPDAFHTVLLRRSIRRLHLCSPFCAPVMLAERLAPPTEGLSWHNTATAVLSWRMKNI